MSPEFSRMSSDPPKIKHPLPEARWPDAAEAEASRLFSPVRLGATTATSRTWVPAMVPWRATEDGFVTEANREWYGRFADGRPGVLVVEATGIRDVPSGPLLRSGHDRFVPGLREMCDVVRERSEGDTRFFVQIIDFLSIRRRPEPEKYFGRFLTLRPEHRRRLAAVDDTRDWEAADEDALRSRLSAATDDELDAVLDSRELESLRMGHRERVNDLHLEHVRDLPQTLPGLFADAARRAREAGFDGDELHFAHAYTMASFLSARNERDDGYGGSREARLRLPLEVIAACRAAVGEDFSLGCRFLGDEVIEGGGRLEDARHYAVGFAEAGLGERIDCRALGTLPDGIDAAAADALVEQAQPRLVGERCDGRGERSSKPANALEQDSECDLVRGRTRSRLGQSVCGG